MKAIVNVNLKQSHKDEVGEITRNTIALVFERLRTDLTKEQACELEYATLDHINNHVTGTCNLKQMWSLSEASTVPVLVDFDTKYEKTSKFELQPNTRWISRKDSVTTKAEFDEEVLKMFMEDVETAAFYIACSVAKKEV